MAINIAIDASIDKRITMYRLINVVPYCFSLEKSAVVSKLQPDSEYEVRVQARLPGLILGGDFSSPIPVTTSSEGIQCSLYSICQYLRMLCRCIDMTKVII